MAKKLPAGSASALAWSAVAHRARQDVEDIGDGAEVTYGLFDADGPLPPPPAAGHELAAAEIRNARLAWSEIVSGLAVSCGGTG